MFKFSEIYSPENNLGVKQILVFQTKTSKDKFEKNLKDRIEKYGFDTKCNTDTGAIYKIIAVKRGNNKWDGCVRCGSSDELLIDEKDLGNNWESAIVNIVNIFNGYIQESSKQIFSFVLNESRKEPMQTYLFASLRGGDFEIQGTSPENAWQNLVEREKENGSIWKTSDLIRNKTAVKRQGFNFLTPGGPAYKQIS